MKRYLRWGIWVLAGIFALLLLLSFIIPLLFKDPIKQQITKVVNEQVNAKVAFQDFSLSMWKAFPYLSATLQDLSIIGKGAFKNDTLIVAQEIGIGLNLWRLITNPTSPEISHFYIKNAHIHAKVLKDGRANWDIMKPSETQETDTTEETTDFNIKLKSYELENVHILYEDKSLNTYVNIENLTHSGKGNFSASQFELKTQTNIDAITLRYDNTTYMNKMKINGYLYMFIDLEKGLYEFRENEIQCNDFPFSILGSITLKNDTTYDMTLDIECPTSDFRSLISLIPAFYLKDFEQLQVKGKFSMKLHVAGTYDGYRYPKFSVQLKVEDGFVKYPDLPDALQKIFIDFEMQNKHPQLEHLKIDLRRFSMHLGQSPLQMQFQADYTPKQTQVKGFLKGDFPLAQWTRFYPMEGYTLQGRLYANIRLDGVYSETQLPAIDGLIELQKGYVKTKDYPTELKDIAMKAWAKNTTGNLNDFTITIDPFSFLLDNQPVKGSFTMQSLDNPRFTLNVNGTLDLEKLLQLYPMEGTQLQGIVNVSLMTQGDMRSIEQEAYHNIKTKGQLTLQHFFYKDNTLPQGIKISSAKLSFSPAYVALEQLQGRFGKSDFAVKGRLENYWGYLLKDQTLKGQLQWQSNYLDLNPWLAESSEETTTDTAEVPLEAPEIPKNIHFTAQAQIQSLIYETYHLNNFIGRLTLKDGVVYLDQCDFTLLGGRFQLKGKYDGRNIQQPKAFFAANIQNLDLQKAYNNFEIMKKYVPIGAYTNGIMNLKTQMELPMNSSLEPLYDQLFCDGMAQLRQTAIKDAPIQKGLVKLTRSQQLNPIRIADQKIQFSIKNGRLYVEPFSFQSGETSFLIAGSNGLDQSIDYTIIVTTPVKGIAASLQQQILTSLNANAAAVQRARMHFKATGPFNKPKITLTKVEAAEGEGAATDLQQQAQELKEQLQQQAQQQLQQAQQQAQQQVQQTQQQIQQQAQQQVQQTQQQVQQQAQQQLQQVQQQAQEEKEKLKNKLKGKLPKWP